MGSQATPTPHTVSPPTDAAQRGIPAQEVATSIPQEVGSILSQIDQSNSQKHTTTLSPSELCEITSGGYDNAVGGRVRLFYDKWQQITSDPFILEAVRGYKLEFNEAKMPPNRDKPLSQYKTSQLETASIDGEISNLLSKNVIEECGHEKGEFLSNIFTRPKKSGGVRLILDLSELNKSLNVQHFKMDSVHTAAYLISQDFFLASVDLRDAYYSIPIDPRFRKYLKFPWRGKCYQYKALPNGLSTAPRLFTKLLKPVLATLREMGHVVVAYLDDTIIIGETREQTAKAVKDTTRLFTELGFIVHDEKSVLAPQQELKFLGFTLNTVNMTICLPEDKAQDISTACSELHDKIKPTVRQVSHVIGKIIAALPGVQYGPMFYRNLERDKISALKNNRGHFDRAMNLSEEAKEELKWWINNIDKQFSPIRRNAPTVELRTDASGLGWGATDLNRETGGRWNEAEMIKAGNNAINYLETLAAGLGLKSLCSNVHDAHILLRLDNTTAVAYLNNMGGVKSKDCDLAARDIWRWCMEHNIWITASHLPGRDNTEADERSRKFNDRNEWMLNKGIFKKISSKFGHPEIDLFASRLNNQLKRYVTWLPDPNAESIDAFTLDWGKMYFYAFPPFCLIPRCLQKIRMDRAEGLLVVPNWPTQSWFPSLQRLLCEKPFFIQRRVDLLTQPVSGDPHPLHKQLDLICCRLCGSPSKGLD